MSITGTNSKTTNVLLGLRAETPLHAGAGQSAGAIDLPIQREAHTDWPCVFGSAVKGALRARSEDPDFKGAQRLDDDLRCAVFGPDTKHAEDNAGALLVGDARLLLLPVRSLTSHFKWVTCPALLRRFQADATRLGHTLPAFEVPTVTADTATLCLPTTAVGTADETLFLEEFRLTVVREDLSSIVEALATVLPGGTADVTPQLTDQLAIVDDDLFGYLSRFSVPVAAHVCIDNQTKTVKAGALWYEETLPPETVLYVALSAWKSRKKDYQKTAPDLLGATLSGLFGDHPYLQLGGNETVGMGWCQVNVPAALLPATGAAA